MLPAITLVTLGKTGRRSLLLSPGTAQCRSRHNPPFQGLAAPTCPGSLWEALQSSPGAKVETTGKKDV